MFPSQTKRDALRITTAQLREDAVTCLKEQLLPLAEVITPNIPEAEVLAEMPIHTPHDMEMAAERIGKRYG